MVVGRNLGRVGDADQALAVPAEPVCAVSALSGFDPSRDGSVRNLQDEIDALRGNSRCYLFHKWRRYGPSQVAEGSRGEPVVVQFRECARCGARDARRVESHR